MASALARIGAGFAPIASIWLEERRIGGSVFHNDSTVMIAYGFVSLLGAIGIGLLSRTPSEYARLASYNASDVVVPH